MIQALRLWRRPGLRRRPLPSRDRRRVPGYVADDRSLMGGPDQSPVHPLRKPRLREPREGAGERRFAGDLRDAAPAAQPAQRGIAPGRSTGAAVVGRSRTALATKARASALRSGARRRGGRSGGAARPAPGRGPPRTCGASPPAGRPPRRGKGKVPLECGARRLIRTFPRTWSRLPVCCGVNTFSMPEGRLHIQAEPSKNARFSEKTARPRSSARGSPARTARLDRRGLRPYPFGMGDAPDSHDSESEDRPGAPLSLSAKP